MQCLWVEKSPSAAVEAVRLQCDIKAKSKTTEQDCEGGFSRLAFS
jgi:hypothetical protein